MGALLSKPSKEYWEVYKQDSKQLVHAMHDGIRTDKIKFTPAPKHHMMKKENKGNKAKVKQETHSQEISSYPQECVCWHLSPA